jgi:hypothetical protein
MSWVLREFSSTDVVDGLCLSEEGTPGVTHAQYLCVG